MEPGALGRRRRRGGAFSIARLFANGEAGGVYDPSDLTAEKVAWRRNLYLYSEPTSATGYTATNVTFTTNALFNFLPGGGACAELADATVSRSLRQSFTLTAGVTYTLSFYVTIAGGGLPNSGSGAYRDFTITRDTQDVTDYASITYENLGGGVYRARHTWLHAGISGNVTVQKYSGLNTNTAVRFTGLQLEVSATATAYQRITDFTSDFLAAFPTHGLYQDSAGTTPVTALGQPVGLVIDSKTGGLANLGPELVTNGDFSSGTGWTLSAGGAGSATIAGGILTLSGGSGDFPSATQSGILVSGRRYRVIATTTSAMPLGALGVRIGGSTNQLLPTAANTYFAVIEANGTDLRFIRNSGYTETATIDSVSVREVPGVHAIQATSSSRPLLDGRVNLLTFSEQFDNAAWTKYAGTTISANSAIAPDGTTTADLVYPASSGTRGVYAALSGTYLLLSSVYAKVSGKSWLQIVGSQGASNSGVWFNVSTGVVGTQASGYIGSISSVGNGWYRCSVAHPLQSNTFAECRIVDSDGVSTVTANGTDGLLLWGADARLATDAAYPYQRVAAATDYADVGVPRSFAFDGFDDSLYTASNMDLSGTDKVTVLAGVRKLSDAAAGMIVELSANGDSNNGAFYVSASPSGQPAYATAVRGTSLGYYVPVTYTAPITNVVAVLADIGASTLATEIVPRINGVVDQDGGVGSVGTGNFGNYVLFIGRRNNTSNPFNGKAYQLIVRGALTDDATLAQAQRYVGAKTGLYL